MAKDREQMGHTADRPGRMRLGKKIHGRIRALKGFCVHQGTRGLYAWMDGYMPRKDLRELYACTSGYTRQAEEKAKAEL